MKWGNSLAVRIPKAVAEQARIREGDPVVIEAVDGRVEVRSREQIPSLKELVAKIRRDNRFAEMDWGREAGKEEVEW